MSGAELASATIEITGPLKIFDNGNAKNRDRRSTTVVKYDEDGEPIEGFRGFWWAVDAFATGSWEANATGTMTNDKTGVAGNTLRGNNDAVKSVTFEVVNTPTEGWLLEGGSGGSYQVLIPKFGGSATVRATATTEMGILTGQVSWYKNGKYDSQGATLQWGLIGYEAGYDVIAFGNAENAKDGSNPGGAGPLANDKHTGKPKPDPEAGESTSTIAVDGAYAEVVLGKELIVARCEYITAAVKCTGFDHDPGPPEVAYWDSGDKHIIRIKGGHNHGKTQVEIWGANAGSADVIAYLKPPSQSGAKKASSATPTCGSGDKSSLGEVTRFTDEGVAQEHPGSHSRGEPPPPQAKPHVTRAGNVVATELQFIQKPPPRVLVHAGCRNIVVRAWTPYKLVAKQFKWEHECMQTSYIEAMRKQPCSCKVQHGTGMRGGKMARYTDCVLYFTSDKPSADKVRDEEPTDRTLTVGLVSLDGRKTTVEPVSAPLVVTRPAGAQADPAGGVEQMLVHAPRSEFGGMSEERIDMMLRRYDVYMFRADITYTIKDQDGVDISQSYMGEHGGETYRIYYRENAPQWACRDGVHLPSIRYCTDWSEKRKTKGTFQDNLKRRIGLAKGQPIPRVDLAWIDRARGHYWQVRVGRSNASGVFPVVITGRNEFRIFGTAAGRVKGKYVVKEPAKKTAGSQ